MKPFERITLLVFWLTFSSVATAAIHYVDVNSALPTPPYLTWATAATNIQDAVDAAIAGDQVLVTNGVYQTGGRSIGFDFARVVVDKAITIQSSNGPQFTVIDGRGSGRCAVLTNGVTFSGFTLTNGFSDNAGQGGGGVAFMGSPSDAIVTNCVITRCLAHYGGAAGSASSVNVYPPVGGTLVNCTISNNVATGNDYFYGPLETGGGVDSCRLIRCALIGNNATGPLQSKGGGAYASILENCVLFANSTGAGSAGGGAANSALINCTVVSNSANYGTVGGTYACWLTNCIVADNSGTNHDADNFVTYTCTTPMPTNGIGNITNAPLFVNAGAGDFRLQSNSHCIDAGNNSYVTSPVDLDGKERIVGGTVDMGAYEWIAVPTHYVSLNSPNPTPPYLSWFTAATNIQDAVEAAVAGDQILVTNGAYAVGGGIDPAGSTGNNFARVSLLKPVSVRSVNGPQFTLIQGGTSTRCAYLRDNNASLSGFTLTNGNPFSSLTATLGGGVYCSGTNAVVSNCVIVGCSATYGAGVYGEGGSRILDCSVLNNSAGNSGGGVAGTGVELDFGVEPLPGCVLSNCYLAGNSASIFGGGAYGRNDSILIPSGKCSLVNCILTNNSASIRGSAAVNCFLNRCQITGNNYNPNRFLKNPCF